MQFDPKGVNLAIEYAETFTIFRSMTFERGYYEFLIGSVTLDSYHSIETSITYILDCTHGYHKTTVHLASRYPDISDNINNPLSVFPYKVWIATLFSLTLITICTLNIIYVYDGIKPKNIKSNLEVSQIVLRLSAGFTEPDDEAWFKNYSAGKFIMLVYSVASFFIVSLYNVDIRAKIIVPEMEKPIDTMNDIDFRVTKILLDYNEGTKLTLSDQAHLFNLLTIYANLTADSIFVCFHYIFYCNCWKIS